MMKLHDKINAVALGSGFLSFISSSLIVTFIPRSNGGLSTPYRRIIFGLSLSDVIQSMAVIFSPFLLPEEERMNGSSWAFGNVHTCDLQGFMLTLGACTTCMYTLFLCLYYYCKLKRHMTDKSFAAKIEKKIHWFIVVVNMVVCSVALATKTFNPFPGAGTCQMVRKPAGCDPHATGSCERGHLARPFGIFYFPVAVPCICFLGTLIFMILITVHVSNQGRMCRNQRTTGDVVEEETEADYVARLLRREAMLQVILYGLAFMLTYGWLFPLLIIMQSNILPPTFVAFVIGVSFPLVGVFNILIYTRPQVVAYRRLHSEVSWPVAFWLVIKAGGENPEAGTASTSPTPSSISKPMFCCRLLCCFTFTSYENEEKQSSSSVLQRLRAFIRARYSSQSVQSVGTVHNQARETSSPDIHGLPIKTSMTPTKNGHATKEGMKDCSTDIVGEQYDLICPEGANDDNKYIVSRKSDLAFTQNAAFSRAFEKATQRAKNMTCLDIVEKKEAESKPMSSLHASESRKESQWSNGVSLGSSFGGSFIYSEVEDNDTPCESVSVHEQQAAERNLKETKARTLLSE